MSDTPPPAPRLRATGNIAPSGDQGARPGTRLDGSSIQYVNLNRAYSNHTLALVVWTRDLPAYKARLGRLRTLEGKRVRALGTIEQYRNDLQIIMRNPQFLRVMAS